MSRWWSRSKKQYVNLSDMPLPHLVSAFAVLARGEYEPPDPIEPGLVDAFEAEFALRCVHPDGTPWDPEDGPEGGERRTDPVE